MIASLADMLGSGAGNSGAQYPFGCTIGVVDNVEDPTGQRRVRVRLTGSGNDLSVWARIVTLGAGNECGVYFAPPLGTQALVYLDGPHAYLLGTVWNGEDKPPPGTSTQREITTPGGNMIRFQDEAGKETIEIVGAGGTSSIVLRADGTVTVSADKKIVLAAQEIELDAGKISMTTTQGGTTIESQGPVAVTTPGTLTLEGKSRVNIN